MKAKIKGMMGAIPLISPMMENEASMWTQPDLIGWLEKRGGKFTSWKRRFFILQGSYLFYFENDFKVQTTQALGVVPLDGSNMETGDEETGKGQTRKYPFTIHMGSHYASIAKRDTYILAAPSRQAWEEWIVKLKGAGESRSSLFGELSKIRWRAGDIRLLLANSPSNKLFLSSQAGPEGSVLQEELSKVHAEIQQLTQQSEIIREEANKQEGTMMRAIVVWDILNEFLTGKAKINSSVVDKLKYETDILQELYKLLQAKGNYLQGQGIEDLSKKSRDTLKKILERALFFINERQAKIRLKSPRYSFNLDPKIYEDGEDELVQLFEADSSANDPTSIKLLNSIRNEAKQTADSLKKVATAYIVDHADRGQKLRLDSFAEDTEVAMQQAFQKSVESPSFNYSSPPLPRVGSVINPVGGITGRARPIMQANPNIPGGGFPGRPPAGGGIRPPPQPPGIRTPPPPPGQPMRPPLAASARPIGPHPGQPFGQQSMRPGVQYRPPGQPPIRPQPRPGI